VSSLGARLATCHIQAHRPPIKVRSNEGRVKELRERRGLRGLQVRSLRPLLLSSGHLCH